MHDVYLKSDQISMPGYYKSNLFVNAKIIYDEICHSNTSKWNLDLFAAKQISTQNYSKCKKSQFSI